MQLKLTRKRNVLAVTAFAVLAVVGVGYAAIPSADGTVKGCYATSDGLLLGIPHSKGDLRAIDGSETCRSYEKPVSWSQRGPKGDTGAQGIQGVKGDTGATGATGPSGAADVHQASNRFTFTINPFGGVERYSAGPLSVSVPAGKYLVMANALVSNSGAGAHDARCTLQGQTVVEERMSGGEQSNLPIMGTVTLASPGSITIDCGPTFTQSSRMFTTNINSITNG